MRSLTKEFIFEIAEKFKTKSEFEKNDSSAYKKACQMGWINEMPWMTLNKKYDGVEYCVYVYKDEEKKVAYIGLTKELHKRHYNHCHPKHNSKSPVYDYFTENNKEIPSPIVLSEKLSAIDAQENELKFYLSYKEMGYTMLNKAKMGVHLGSLGGTYIWDKEGVFNESKKYTNRTDFKLYSNGAYNRALKNKWLKEMEWLKPQKKRNGFWTYEHCVEEANKYRTRTEFQKGAKGAYNACVKNGWLDEIIERKSNRYTKEDIFEIARKYTNKAKFINENGYLYKVCKNNNYFEEMDWLKSPYNQWDSKDKVFECAKECKNRIEFQKKYKGAYDKARHNDWLKEMTWFKELRHNWTFDELLEESKKYSNNKEFKYGCIAAYGFAYKKGYLNEIRKINGWC